MTLCLCGCGRPLKREGSKYATLACVPRAARQMGGRNSRRRFSLNRKARLFGEILKRLDAIQKPTRGICWTVSGWRMNGGTTPAIAVAI
jgi:hypothetical protein